MVYALRNAEGKFVGRARTKVSAHRAARTRKHFGSSVVVSSFNRAASSSDAQAIYEAARDAEYVRLGERHGYSGLAAGVSAVLAARGVRAEPKELTGDFHSQLVGMASHADTATVQDIARNFDSQMHFSSTLPYEVENVGRFHAPYSYGGSVDTGWITSEIDKKLKADKIRRGTKKYREFVATNAERVVSAVREEVRKRAEKQAASQREWAEKHRGEVDKVERSVAHLDRMEEILVALADAASVEPKSIGKLRERREVFRRAVDSMRSSLASAVEPVEADEETVQMALQRPDLKPFAEAVGALPSGENRAGGRAGYLEPGELERVMNPKGLAVYQVPAGTWYATGKPWDYRTEALARRASILTPAEAATLHHQQGVSMRPSSAAVHEGTIYWKIVNKKAKQADLVVRREAIAKDLAVKFQALADAGDVSGGQALARKQKKHMGWLYVDKLGVNAALVKLGLAKFRDDRKRFEDDVWVEHHYFG